MNNAAKSRRGSVALLLFIFIAAVPVLVRLSSGGSRSDASTSLVNTPTPAYAYRPPPTWDQASEELQRRYHVREATRVAVLTAIPQNGSRPNRTLTPIVWPTAIPIPTSVYYPAGDGMILEDGQIVPAELGSFTNQWQQRVGDVYTQVYFGKEKYDPTQGIVLVKMYGPGHPMEMEIYRTPQARGAVRVVGATGTTLQARTEMGDYIVFDLATRQWVSPPLTPGPSPSVLVSPVPSVSPLPTQSP
jgi:hypothetical protein